MNHRRYLRISAAVGIVSVVLALLSFAFAHGSVVIGTIVFGFLSPAIFLARAFNVDSALSASFYAFVFATQFATSYVVCLVAGAITSDVRRTKSVASDV
jgi:hypothetical protein